MGLIRIHNLRSIILNVMHILLIHQAFAAINEPGGTRHYEFARYLVAQGQRVTIIASPVSYLTGMNSLAPAPETRPAKAEGGEQQFRVIRARTYSAHHKSFIHRLFAFISFMVSSFWIGLSVRNVDIVWGTSPPIFQGFTAWALARLKDAAFLFEVRDLWPKFAIAVGVLKNPVLITLSNWLERFLYRHADRVMVNSPGFAAHVIGLGVRQVELIPNGSDPEMFDPQDDGALFRSANQLEGKFVVLYAGAHGLSNDLGVVLDAAKIIQERPETREVMIVFLGDGKEKTVLQKQAGDLRLTNVLFLPPVPKNQIPGTLAGADACLAILKPLEEYKTTYPNKVFDYMAAGRPVILAIDGVIREVVEAAHCGVFIPPGEPSALAEGIAKLSADKNEARKSGLQGREYLEEHFSRMVTAEKLARLLKSMTK